MSDMTIKIRADRLTRGQCFVFTDDLGGEGEVLTVDTAVSFRGIVEVTSDEYEWTIEILDNAMVEIRSREED